MKVASWNVNGLRSCVAKGLLRWLGRCGCDYVGVQETRVDPGQIPAEVLNLRHWQFRLNAARRKGYSGVGAFTRNADLEWRDRLGVESFDVEGRFLETRIGKLRVVNSYFPNGNGKDRDLSRIPFKLDYYRRLFDELAPVFKKGERILVLGDFNTAHQPIDLKRPKDNEKNSGFRPEERAELTRWIDYGWVDTFRRLHPERPLYSWWSARYGVREKNIGWRIDYVLASPAAFEFVRAAEIHTRVMGSDHCPISVELDDAVEGR